MTRALRPQFSAPDRVSVVGHVRLCDTQSAPDVRLQVRDHRGRIVVDEAVWAEGGAAERRTPLAPDARALELIVTNGPSRATIGSITGRGRHSNSCKCTVSVDEASAPVECR